MKSYSQEILIIFCLVFSLQLRAESEPQWLGDAKLALGDDLKEKFRAKDRLKELDHLDDLLERELRGANQRLVLDLVKELKLRSLILDIKNLALEKDDRYLFEVFNSLTVKDEVKVFKEFYQQLKKKGKRSSFQGFIEFFDLYNQFIDFADLADIFQNGDDQDKEKVSEYLVLHLDSYETSQVSFFMNTALSTATLNTKIILMSGLRRRPDTEIKKYSINFKICEKDSDKVLADLCHRLWLYTEKKSR